MQRHTIGFGCLIVRESEFVRLVVLLKFNAVDKEMLLICSVTLCVTLGARIVRVRLTCDSRGKSCLPQRERA